VHSGFTVANAVDAAVVDWGGMSGALSTGAPDHVVLM
jgi:hypothetical protein